MPDPTLSAGLSAEQCAEWLERTADAEGGEPNEDVSFLAAAAAHLRRLSEVNEKYYALLWGVADRYPNESREETARRFIQEAQQANGTSPTASATPETPDA